MSGWTFIAILSEKISENVGYAREAATEAVLEDTWGAFMVKGEHCKH